MRSSCRPSYSPRHGLKRVNRWAVEDGNRIAAVLAVAIQVVHARVEQLVRLRADLVGGGVIDAQAARTPPDVRPEGASTRRAAGRCADRGRRRKREH